MKRTSYRLSKSGSLKRLKKITEELPPPIDNEVTVKVKAVGLNFADVFTIQGLYRAAPKKNFIPGLEFSGEIIDCGEKISLFQKGERVMGVIKFGSYTSHLNIDENYLLKLPEDWSYEDGAGFIVQALTAYYALVPLGNLTNEQTVLIHSAAGGVGIYANRIAKKYNAFTIGTIGSSAKSDLLKDEGYDEVIIRNGNFKKELKQKMRGRPLDLILEAVGGSFQKESFELLSETGRMVAYGLSYYASPSARPNYFKLAYNYLTRPKYDTLALIESNKSILGFNLIWLYERNGMLKKYLAEIEKLKLEKPFIGHIFDFNQLINAVQLFQSGKTKGKVIVKIAD